MKKLILCTLSLLILIGCSTLNPTSNTPYEYSISEVNIKRQLYLNELFSTSSDATLPINKVSVSIIAIEPDSDQFIFSIFNDSDALFKGNINLPSVNTNIKVNGLSPGHKEEIKLKLNKDYIDDHKLSGELFPFNKNFIWPCEMGYGFHDNSSNSQLMNAYISNYPQLDASKRIEIATFFLKYDLIDNIPYDTKYYIMDESQLTLPLEERVVLFIIHVYPSQAKVIIYNALNELETTIEL